MSAGTSLAYIRNSAAIRSQTRVTVVKRSPVAGSGGSAAAAFVPESSLAEIIRPGAVIAWAGTAIPTGWLECDGSTISRSSYASLFAAIGTTFGAGDGVNTFEIPDLTALSASPAVVYIVKT